MAAADASGGSGVSTGIPRPLHLRARTGGRPGQRREGVDTCRHGRSMACAACRSRGPSACRARADAPHDARCHGLMAYDSAAISTKVSDSMGSEGAACSHLHEGREGADQGGEGCVVKIGRKGGGEIDGEPCLYVQEAALSAAGEQSRRQGHVCGLRSWNVAECAVLVRHVVGPLSKGRHPT